MNRGWPWQQYSCGGNRTVRIAVRTLDLLRWACWVPIPSVVRPAARHSQRTLGVLVHPPMLSLHTPHELEQEWGGVSESQKMVNHSWNEGALKTWLISVACTGKKRLFGCDWQLPCYFWFWLGCWCFGDGIRLGPGAGAARKDAAPFGHSSCLRAFHSLKPRQVNSCRKHVGWMCMLSSSLKEGNLKLHQD